LLLPLYSARKQYRGQPNAQGAKQFDTDDSGVSIHGDGIQVQMRWANYVRAFEAKNVILLYTQPCCFQIIPKRSFTEPQLIEFRELLKARIPKR